MHESTTLLERTTAGVRVEINWLPVTGTVVLRVEANGTSAFTTIAPDRAKDAFDHPFAYLSDEDTARVLPRP